MNKTISLAVCAASIVSMLMLTSARAADSWAAPLPPPPTAEQAAKFGFKPLDFQTTFTECRLGSHAPINNQTAVGVPGWPLVGFNYLMRVCYSEFEANFSMDTDNGPKRPYLLPNFAQSSPGGWLPGAVNEWDYDGIHYRVTFISVPNDPQPVDICEIVLKNTGSKGAKGRLSVTLDGAPTLAAQNDLIADRGKPLVVMNPAVPTERIARDSGCLDPRAIPAAPWHPCQFVSEWTHCRLGWYGIPIEYLIKADGGKSQQVFLGMQFSMQTGLFCDAVQAGVEGAGDAQIIKHDGTGDWKTGQVQRFVGKDVDGDGYIKISVSAAPGSKRRRASLAVIRTFDMDTAITAEEVRADKGKEKARTWIDVGADFPGELTMLKAGTDPTVFALRLSYAPELAPGEEKSYVLKFPAIDRKEPAWCANSPRPYDTGENWKGWGMEPRDTDSSGSDPDVPQGFDRATYGTFGPKPKSLWDRQLAAARSLTWLDAIKRLQTYWDAFASQGTKFLVPDKDVEDLYKHQLATLEIYRCKWGPNDYWMQLNGTDFYWEYCSRDGSYENVSWDVAGFPTNSRQLLDTLLTPKSKLPKNRYTFGQWDDASADYDGAWQTRGNQWDAQGQTLWAITEHYLMTADKKWLAGHYDAIKRGGEWIIRRRKMERERIGDPKHPAYGLMPMAGEEPPIGGGHALYPNAYCILGLRRAAMAASDLGHKDDAKEFSNEAEDLTASLKRAIRLCFIRLNDFAGSIPHSVDVGEQILQGKANLQLLTDFGGAMVWPTEAIAPHDPLMNAFYQYRNYVGSRTGGIMDWAYIYMDLATGYIRRGEPDKAADLFFSYVDNASGTHDWGECMRLEMTFPEFDPPKVGVQGTGDGPHGEACANYINFLRNLMLHEEGDSLHIAPAIPRRWLSQPTPVGLEGAPSHFGPVTYHLVADPDRSTIRGDIKLDPTRKPAKLIIHVRGPGGRGLESVKINGKKWDAFSGDEVIVADPESHITLEARYRSR